MKTVIYHSADYDGIFCREIAKHFLSTQDVNYIGWNFGDPPLPIPPEGTVYVLDLPVDRTFGFDFAPIMANMPGAPSVANLISRIVWIDHHKSSIESHPTSIPGYRIDGVAACRLAWQLFRDLADVGMTNERLLPKKEQYRDRLVTEPLAVRLAGEHDVWDHRDERAEQLQYGLRVFGELDSLQWLRLLREDKEGEVADIFLFSILVAGDAAQRYAKNVDASTIKTRGFLLQWEGLTWLALNTARCNSSAFAALDVPETGHDALLGYFWNGKQWSMSLYHAKHRTDLDLSAIAKKYGGGGHKGACGFQTVALPTFHYAEQKPCPSAS